MIRRAWLLLCALWAFVFLANGMTKVDGVRTGDILLAAAPWLAGRLLGAMLRFTVTGSPLKDRGPVPYRRP